MTPKKQLMHLTPDEFVDVAEGVRDAGSLPHLAICDACRRQLDDVRSALATAAGAADVPEPSPLFWEHFSERVRVAVAADAASRSALWRRMWIPASLVAAAAVVVLAILTMRMHPALPSADVPGQPSTVAVAREPLSDLDSLTETDNSLTLVAELTAALDFDGARDAGLAARGAAEHAVTHLNDGELRELRRLIEQQMVNP